MSLGEYIKNAPRKKAKKKATKKAEDPKPVEKVIEKIIEKPIKPIIKVIEQPNYAPMVSEQAENIGRIAEQAIASMRDSVNNNQAVMAEIVKQIGNRPKEFLVQRDKNRDISKIIPVYEDDR